MHLQECNSMLNEQQSRLSESNIDMLNAVTNRLHIQTQRLELLEESNTYQESRLTEENTLQRQALEDKFNCVSEINVQHALEMEIKIADITKHIERKSSSYANRITQSGSNSWASNLD